MLKTLQVATMARAVSWAASAVVNYTRTRVAVDTRHRGTDIDDALVQWTLTFTFPIYRMFSSCGPRYG